MKKLSTVAVLAAIALAFMDGCSGSTTKNK